MAKREGFPTVTPYLIFADAAAAFAYYQRVFDAEEISAHRDAAGVLRHGELRIGDSPVMLAGAVPEYPFCQPAAAQLFVYCDDADAWFQKVVAAGASVVMEMSDQSYGRTGGVKDPFGITWWITTHRD